MTDWQAEFRDAISDRYQLHLEIGRGGMAAVFLAKDLRHDRNVAVKVILPERASELAADRFMREIEVAARLSHPHIVPLLDSGQAGEFLYYVMPYIEGESVRDRLHREGPLPITDTVKIIREVSAALTYAHERGVIHRDIKPENILLSAGVAVVADFGIARAVSADTDERRSSLTQAGLAVGTPAYMSPEQASGKDVDGRSDLYSLAVTVYEMLGGELPFSGMTPQAIYWEQLEGPPSPLGPRRKELPAQVDSVLQKALSPTPAERFRTASQFGDALEACLTAPDAPAGTTVRVNALGGRPAGSPRRWVLPAMAVLITVGLAWAGSRLAREPAPAGPAADVAVFPFRSTGSGGETLGEGIADLTAAALDGTVGISVADPAALWQSLRRDPARGLEPPELEEGRRLAGRVNARHLVLGTVNTLGERIDISARVYTGDGSPTTTLRFSTRADSLHHAVDRLAIDIVRAIWTARDDPIVPTTAELATSSIEALQSYVAARSAAARGDFEAALTAIERAVEVDSTFALAHLEHFKIRSWLLFQNGQPYTGLTAIIDRAMANRDRLPPRERYRIEGHKALDRTDGAGAAGAFERILAMDPSDRDALQALAFTYLSYGWQLDKGFDEIEQALRRLLDADPASVWGRAILARIAAMTGDVETTVRLLDELQTRDSTNLFAASTVISLRAVIADSAELRSRLEAAAAEPIPTITNVIRDLRNTRPAAALEFVRILAADSMPVRQQQTASGSLAQIRMGTGDVMQVDSAVLAGTYDRLRSTINRFFVTAALAEVGPQPPARRAARELADFAPADSLNDYLNTRPSVWATGWAVGAYEATFGDTVAARTWQRAIEQLDGGGTSWDWRGSLSADLDARLAVRRGDLAAAAEHARLAYDRWSIHSMNAFESEPEPAMRFHLAEVLRRVGRPVEASRLYRSFLPPHNWSAFYTARSAFELAELARGTGEWSDAQRDYGVALALWNLGGDEIADWRSRARAGLDLVLAETR